MARVTVFVAVVLLAFMAMNPVNVVAEKRWTVGDKKFWNPNVNYTIWTQGKHFYLDDWLYFVYNRYQYNVIEVKKTNYITCNSENPIANWSRGAGRDVVHLNETRHYYLISGTGGGCFNGMKLDVLVEKRPLPPTASPIKNTATTTFMITLSGFVLYFVLPVAVFSAMAIMSNNVLRF